jgi:hypothetical protein
MNKIILFGIFTLLATSMCLAQTNQTESLTISTYYPSPYGVYKYLKLSPTDVPGGPDESRGVIYYDNTSNSIFYRNNTGWVDTSAGGSGGGGSGNDAYWNKTGSNNIYNNNTDFVGIGNTSPSAPLMVYMSNSDPSNATVASFIKREALGVEQKLLFNLYPPDLWRPYMNATSVILTPKSPPGNLEFATGNLTNHIRFNVGGAWDEESEVMRLVNSDPPDPRVGIGTDNPLATLHVENNDELTGPLMIRGTIVTQAGLYKKTGIFNIAPWRDRVYLMFGMYAKDGYFYNDPYTRWDGTTNDQGGKLCIRPIKPSSGADKRGMWWHTYNSGNLGPGGRIDSWDQQIKLWDHLGKWQAGVSCPSSRKVKENISAIDLEDILGKIDRLEVSRWNYKSWDKSDHIGPIAEDFYRLFKTGSREDQLYLTDTIGVSLAGVKALLAKERRQEQRLEELGQEIEELKAQLSKKKAGKF